VRISGQLVARNPTALLAGRQVSLYSKANLRTAAWSRVGSNRTNSRGVYAFAVRPSQNTVYQVVFRASGGLSTASASYLQAVRAPLTGSSVTPGGIVAAGSTLAWRASTTVRLAGKVVSVQLRTTTGWVSVNSGHVAKNGGIAVRFAVNERGLKTYRLYLPGSSLYAGSAVATRINVYQWFYLSDFSRSYTGNFNINGVNYAKSLYGGWWGTIRQSFDLGRKCAQLRTTVGLSDLSQADTRADFSYDLDATSVPVASGVRLGQAFPVARDVTSILRLHVSAQQTAGSGAMVYGNFRVLCSMPPTYAGD